MKHDIYAAIRLLLIFTAVILAAIMCREERDYKSHLPTQAAEAAIVSEPPPEEPEPRYPITDEERKVIEQVVMAEAGGESYAGQKAVAQCILNAAELEGIRPTEAVVEYKYTPNRETPTESVQEAVSAVFDAGDFPINDTPLWFYAPARCAGKWHETQRFVAEIGGHKFFAAWS